LKNLIVPTNFSENADQVLGYAIQLANQLEANIHLVHVYSKNSSFDRGQSRKNVLLKLEQSAAKFERKLFFTTFVKPVFLEGLVVNQLCSYSRKIDADLIVMGGAESWRRTGLNQIITEVVRKSRTSVFVIPNGYKYQPINCLTLAIDKKVSSKDPEIISLKLLIESINGKLKILEAAKNRILTCVEAGCENEEESLPFEVFTMKHEAINKGIQHFIAQSKTDVLCFINREYGLSGRFLNNLRTKIEDHHERLIPLLLLHEKMSRFDLNQN